MRSPPARTRLTASVPKPSFVIERDVVCRFDAVSEPPAGATVIVVSSSSASGALIVCRPATTWIAARRPLALSKPCNVIALAPLIEYALVLLNASMPTVRGASTLTVRVALAWPKYAVCPAAPATPPLVQLPAAPQLPELATFHNDHVGGAAMFTA